MNWLDVIIIIALIAFIWEGFHRGTIMEIFEILIITLDPLLVTLIYPFLARPIIHHTTIPALYVNVVCFILFFSIIAMVLWVISGKIELLLHIPYNSSLNRAGGMIFGFVKGAVVLWWILFAIGQFHLRPPTREYYHASSSVRKIQGFSGWVKEAIHTLGSEHAYEYMAPRIDKARF